MRERWQRGWRPRGTLGNWKTGTSCDALPVPESGAPSVYERPSAQETLLQLREDGSIGNNGLATAERLVAGRCIARGLQPARNPLQSSYNKPGDEGDNEQDGPSSALLRVGVWRAAEQPWSKNPCAACRGDNTICRMIERIARAISIKGWNFGV